jgi:hypothetical protein
VHKSALFTSGRLNYSSSAVGSCVSLQGYILCTVLHRTFYVLCFIIPSRSYVSQHILCPVFHQTFYALCFITFQVLVLPYIPRPMIYHTIYILCFITHSMPHVFSNILRPTFYHTFYALYFIIHCMSNVNKFSSNSYSQFVKHSLLPNNEPH